MKKTITFFTSLIVMILMSMTVNAQVIISGYIANPAGSDSAFEYVQLVATQNINFATTNYSVVFLNNGAALPSGWIAGNAISYGFNLTSGSVNAGETFYVGGSGKRICGTGSTDISSLNWIKVINTVSTAGDGFGNANASGVFGNGGTNADGVGVFSGLTSAITSTTIPIDAIFYGTAIGTAKPATGGYVLPTNDRYSNAQGTFGNGTNTYLFSDAISNVFVHLSGTYNTNTSSWSINRTGVPDTLTAASPITKISSQIVLVGGAATAPTIATGTTTGITSTVATCAGNITSDGGAAITAKGICYGASINPDITGTKVIVAGSTIGVFTGNLTSLTAGNTYHYRAYATNSAGTAYGADSTFTTATGAVVPVVVTGVASAIATTTATVAGDVTNDGGTTLTEKGICFGITVNPDITGTKVIVSGTSIGAFTGNLTGLTASTLYHARAYATNAIGSSYGADITFTTQLAGVPCATIAELRSKTADNSTIYQLTGEAFLTFKQTYKGQKWIQDATGAIMIYDGATTPVISTVYNIGDGITGIKGKLDRYYGLLEFVPVADPGAATSTGHVTVPTEVTAADLAAADTNAMYVNQSKLIKLVGVSFTDANGALKFSTNKKIRMTQGATTDSLFFTNFFDANYVVTATASIIPSGLGNVTGICILSKGNYYITARDKADISLLNGINEIESNTIGIYPNPSNGKFTVNVENFNNGEIKVYSIVGSLILSQSINKANNEFDLSNNGKGLYFVQYTDTKSGKSWTEKLIVK